jgi:V8-like Glu-specific endopeptidase
MAEQSAEQLADALRPVIESNHEEYIGEPQTELAASIKADTPQPTMMTDAALPDGSKPPADNAREFRAVVGPDDRGKINGGGWPWTAIANMSGMSCTYTRVGQNTLITAAHCLYKGGWFAPGTISFDVIDGVSKFSVSLPAGCYYRAVPNGWISDNSSFDYDYGVIKIGGGATWCPAVNTGWFGTRTDTPPQSNVYGYALYGYPAKGQSDTPVCNGNNGCSGSWTYPSLWGTALMTLAGQGGTEDFYDIDASEGDSGAILYQYNDNRAFAIHKGWGTYVWWDAWCFLSCAYTDNLGRQIDNTVFNFISNTYAPL